MQSTLSLRKVWTNLAFGNPGSKTWSLGQVNKNKIVNDLEVTDLANLYVNLISLSIQIKSGTVHKFVIFGDCCVSMVNMDM